MEELDNDESSIPLHYTPLIDIFQLGSNFEPTQYEEDPTFDAFSDGINLKAHGHEYIVGFEEAKEEGTLEDFLPVINEILLDAEITIAADTHPDYPLTRDYKVHLQGIIDRMFKDGDIYVPLELKTGAWKDWKKTMMRKEMAFYKILFENTPDEK